MAIELKLPNLGEGIDAAEVVNVFVAVGDVVSVEQELLEVETGKASMPIPSTHAGTVTEVLVAAGDSVAINQVIVRIDAAGAEPAAAATAAAPEPQAAATPAPALKAKSAEPKASKATPAASTAITSIEIKLPNLGEGIEAADVVSLSVQLGDTVEVEQELLEVETGKASMPIPSSHAGKITKILVAPGDKITVNQVLLYIDAIGGQDAPAAKQEHVEAELEPTTATVVPEPKVTSVTGTVVSVEAAISNSSDNVAIRAVPASPSVRRLAREIGINIAEVKGTGPKGRISKEDVKAYSRAKNNSGGVAVSGASASIERRALPDFSKFGSTRAEPVKGIRKITAQHMSYCWSSIPHVTQYDKADITDLDAHRRVLAKKLPIENGGKLTITSILVKIVGAALQKFPNFNVSYDDINQQIVFKDYVNVGVAVDTPKGLVVPVIQNVDQKGIAALSGDLGKYSGLAREGRLSAADMQGGSITISNLGGIGGNAFTPIINWPEVAILGVSRGELEPVWIDGAFQPRMRVPLSLSYDHRVIDGADGARFLRWICEALENPIVALT